MRHLNEYGVCLLTDVPIELGQIKKVVEIQQLLQLLQSTGLSPY